MITTTDDERIRGECAMSDVDEVEEFEECPDVECRMMDDACARETKFFK